MRKALLAVPVLAVLALARPASALPEIYAGLGATMAGVPSAKFEGLGFGVEAGVDDIFASLGLGAQVDFIDFDPALTAELRYSIIKVPFVRLYTGLGVGVAGLSTETTGTGGAFIGARISIIAIYVGIKLGIKYTVGAADPTAMSSLLTLGFSL